MPIEWDVLSPEFRSWVHDLLATIAGTPANGAAIVSADCRRVICGVGPNHYLDRPCRQCVQLDQCHVGRQVGTAGSPDDLPGLKVWSATDSEMPAFALVQLCDVASDEPTTAVARLKEAAYVVARTWAQWRLLEDDVVRRANWMNAADCISRLATVKASHEEIERQLTAALVEHCRVSSWTGIIAEPGQSPILVPPIPDACPEVLESVLVELRKIDALRQGDWFLMSSDGPLLASWTSLSERTLGPRCEPRSTTVVVPIVVEDREHLSTAARLWVLFAVFAPGNRPSSLEINHIRFLGQSGLIAWESEHRSKEADQKIRMVRESIRSLPGFDELVGETPQMENLRLEILRASRSEHTVLLVGEPGTGKEVIARLIHSNSDRARFAFICQRVAQELQAIRRSSASLYPADFNTGNIIGTEYRDVSGTHGLFPPKNAKRGKSKDAEESSPSATSTPSPLDDSDLENIVQEAERKLPRILRRPFRVLVAALYHTWQADKFFNFLEFDSGAASTENISSELFGVASERFTGVTGGPGRFQTASRCGGTLFLDNIHHLPQSVQAALLKATEVTHEERRVTRLGASMPEQINVQIVVASIQDLRELVEEDKFLVELASRLMVEVIRVPPLRDRRADIPLLAKHFARLRGKTITDDTIELLTAPDWCDSNVRGLRSVVENAAGRVEDDVIRREHVENAMRVLFPSSPTRVINEEERMIRDALRECDGNVTHAGKKIGWSRQKLYRLMKKYKISS